MKELKSVKDIKDQVKELVDSGTDTLKELGDKGRKMAADLKDRVEKTRTKGVQKVSELLSETSLKDIMERFGHMKFPELIEKLRKSEVGRHGESLRQELMAKFRVPSLDVVESLTVAVDKLTKEVAALKNVRQEMKQEMKAELKVIMDQIKALKKPARSA